MNLKQIVSLIARLAVGGILIYSGFSKAVAPSAEFAAALAAYKILPSGIIPPIAMVWPWLELLAGTYIFFGYYTRPFAWIAAGMFATFIVVLASALIRKIDPGSCGCFGIGLTLSLKQGTILDSVLFVFSLLLASLAKTPLSWSADAWINR